MGRVGWKLGGEGRDGMKSVETRVVLGALKIANADW